MNPISQILVTRTGRHYPLSFSTDSATMDNKLLKKMTTKKWSSMLVSGVRKQKAVLKLCNY